MWKLIKYKPMEEKQTTTDETITQNGEELAQVIYLDMKEKGIIYELTKDGETYISIQTSENVFIVDKNIKE